MTSDLLEEPLRSALPDPERTAARRELIVLLVESLDDELREIFLDVSAEGMSWGMSPASTA